VRFDTFAMVDWSGAPDTGPRPKADAIWAAVARDVRAEAPVYLRNVRTAEVWLNDLIIAERDAGRKLMIGFDFPFGYPAGAAARIGGSPDPRALWDWFANAFKSLPKGEGRFHLAARLNARWPGDGPFWFNGLQSDIAGLQRRQPDMPEGLEARRMVERNAKGSFTVWQMGGGGAVGSQAMTGMACLARLRARHGDSIGVWPFDDGRAPVQLVEVWPSLLKAEVAERMTTDPDLPRFLVKKTGQSVPISVPIRDAAQVVVMAEAMWPLQQAGRLSELLDSPPMNARCEEGWILGIGHEMSLSRMFAHSMAEAHSRQALSNDCFALPPGVHWTPVDEALALLRDRLHPVVAVETVPTHATDGRITARDHHAPRANPPGANAAVDGYGFAHGALVAGRQDLPLVEGRAAAGAPFGGIVPPGHALRILTGALVPGGVDTVVLQEDCTVSHDHVAFAALPKPGANTRRAGEDVAQGALALPRGHVLRPPDLALLAAVGCAEVSVFARLRVGVLSTGDELCAPGATADPARTYDANRPMLLALVARWGCVPLDLGHVGDDRAALRARLDTAGCDAVLTSGGASAGEEDHVSAILREAGALTAWRIALKPGRPLALGVWNGRPVFGLPGNPVAALVCALIFARPALGLLAGAGWRAPMGFDVPAAFEKRKKAGRREYLRARLRDGRVEVFGSEGSGRISGLSWAEGLVELAEPAQQVRPGDMVRFLPYGAFGF